MKPCHELFWLAAVACLFAPEGAGAQNGYSFLDAPHAAVSYTKTDSAAASACVSLVSRTGWSYTVVSAEEVVADDRTPEHCRVSGLIAPAIRFQVNLPARWNGRLYIHGNGGFAGTPPDDPSPARARANGLQHGFATAYTDTGHDRRSEPLASFAHDDPQKEIDYAFRAVHLTAVAAKQLAAAYYARPVAFSYWDGCSTGGRQGLMSAERFPSDFDGIVAGAPVLDFTGTVLSYIWNNRALARAPLSLDKVELVAEAVYRQCDARDGLEDGLIDDPRRCDFDPGEQLPECAGADGSDDCFTADEIETLEAIYRGYVFGGKRWYPGQPVGAEARGMTRRGVVSGWTPWILPGERGPSLQHLFMDTFLKYLAFEVDDPHYDWTEFDLDEDPDRMAATRSYLDATEPDLSAFREHGGKIISYFGWADTALNPLRAIQYLEDVKTTVAETADFFRLFMVPGMFHCAGGLGADRFDAMSPLIAWVEADVAPDEIGAAKVRDGVVEMTRPLCPYPQVARYQGSGNPTEAKNFRCVLLSAPPGS